MNLERLRRVYLDRGYTFANASAKLKSIRKQQKDLSLQIRNKLNSIVHSATYSKYLQ